LVLKTLQGAMGWLFGFWEGMGDFGADEELWVVGGQVVVQDMSTICL